MCSSVAVHCQLTDVYDQLCVFCMSLSKRHGHKPSDRKAQPRGMERS